jgi:hypothetical protein
VTLKMRLGALEAVVEARVEERLEKEFMALLELLAQHHSREEFLKVARIAARGPEAGDEGEG